MMDGLARRSATIISMNTSCRIGTIKDLELIQSLNDEIFKADYEYDKDMIIDWAFSPSGKDYFTKQLTGSEGKCFIVEVDGKGEGYIIGAPKIIPYRKSSYFEIETIGVNPEFRSKGFGALLIDKMRTWSKEKGYQTLYVSSYFHNKKANEFYRRIGFTEIDLGLEMEI